MKRLVFLSAIALACGCERKPPPAAYKPNGAHVYVSPEGLGDVDPNCTGKVVPLEPAANIAQTLGVGLARAGFRSVVAPEDDIFVIEPTVHVRACRVGSMNTEASGDLIMIVSKSGHTIDRIVYDTRMKPVDGWVKEMVGYVLASKPIAAALGQ
jgi:hypothetical protein